MIGAARHVAATKIPPSARHPHLPRQAQVDGQRAVQLDPAVPYRRHPATQAREAGE